MTAAPDIDSTEDQACHSGPHGYIQDKPRYLNRLKRIEGQARGISRMVDEDVYCIDILTQISALNSALENVALGLLDDHRSEEHTSELQSRGQLVCRLLLEQKTA